MTETEELTSDALDYLRERMEIRSQSICKKFFPVNFGKIAAVTKTDIILPTPTEISTKEILKTYAMQIHESSHVEFGSLDFEKGHKVIIENNLNYNKAHELINIVEDYRVNTLQLYSHPGAGKLMEIIHKEIVKDRTYTTPIDALLPVLCGYPTNVVISIEDQKKLDKAVEIAKPISRCYDLTLSLDLLPKLYDLFYEREKEIEDESEWAKDYRISDEKDKEKLTKIAEAFRFQTVMGKTHGNVIRTITESMLENISNSEDNQE